MIPTVEENENRKIINSGAAITRNKLRMRHLNLFVFVEAIFEPPLTLITVFFENAKIVTSNHHGAEVQRFNWSNGVRLNC